jgi:hypothetical protein
MSGILASLPGERRTLDINAAVSEIDGFSVNKIAAEDYKPRPAPHFVYGPADPDALRHFHNDGYLLPVSVYSIRNIEVVGPWFISGTLLIRDEIDIRCDGISLNPENDESRKRLQEHFTATKSGQKNSRHVKGQSLLLANNGHQIYGHWLTDFLPKLYLLELAGLDIRRINVLLPSNMGVFGGTFLKLLGFSEEQIIRYDPDKETILPEELIVPTDLRCGGRCVPMFADAVAYLNERLDQFNRLPVSTNRRIFLSRKQNLNAGRPLVNHAQIEEMAIAAGLMPVYPEDLPLLEQIALFRGARRIIGQYGSALHATIFSRPGVIVGGLHGQLPATFDALQSGVGERIGQLTGYVFGSSVPEQDNPYTMSINAADFAECLKNEFSI